MSAAAVLAEAVACGLTLTVEGQKIIYTGPREAVTDGLLDRLRQHKPELLKLLAAPVTRQTLTNYGADYRHPDGRVETGTLEPTLHPMVAWPTDLTDMLRRVAVWFEWTQTDVRDFRQWAMRSPEGLADARLFLQSECDRLDICLAKGGRISE